jgi:hypothetical protein
MEMLLPRIDPTNDAPFSFIDLNSVGDVDANTFNIVEGGRNLRDNF